MLRYISLAFLMLVPFQVFAGTATGGGSTMGIVIGNPNAHLSINPMLKNSKFLPINYVGQLGESDIVTIKPSDYEALSRSPERRIIVKIDGKNIYSTVAGFSEDGYASIKTLDDKEILVAPADSEDQSTVESDSP